MPTGSNNSSKAGKKTELIIIPFRSALKWLVRLRRSPRAIAGGFALGTFIAFTPTLGFQIGIAIFFATILKLNRPAAILTVWITNAATMAPIYTFNYWIGSFIWSGPDVSEVYKTFAEMAVQLFKLDIWEIGHQFKAVLNLSTEIFIPLVIGSIIVGIAAAFLTYLICFSIIHALLIRRAKRHVLDDR